MSRNRQAALALAMIALAACALYLPFLGNPPVFDDRGLYSGYKFSDYATSPLGLGLRFPPYFSFAFAEVMWGSVEVHRLVTLALHVGCGWALFALIRQFHEGTLLPFAAAAWFVLHPVAVYGAGYLVQRSIVMATLFGLLSILLYVRGLRQARLAGAIGAALAYSLAVLSKEHAILVAAAALAVTPLAGAERRFALRYAGLFLAACVPAAILVVLSSKGIIGTTYEPQFEAITAEVSRGQGGQPVESPWRGSALAQAAMFFRYLALWLWPDTSRMAIDLKVDFAGLWSPGLAAAAVAGFFAWGALGAFLVARRGRGALAGFGMLYTWILFLVEFTVIRYQEPFVLYRSYLWAPGIALALVSLLEQLPRPVVAIPLLAGVIALPVQSHDRLVSFSGGRALWEDAVAKLPSAPVPGGARPFYMLGREYLYAERPADAIKVVERCIELYPGTADCHFARAAIHMSFEEHQAAIPYLLRAIVLQPKAGGARHHLGWALESLGCIEQAKPQYRAAADLGFVGGSYRLMALESPGRGLIGPAAKKRGPCPPAIRSAKLPPG